MIQLEKERNYCIYRNIVIENKLEMDRERGFEDDSEDSESDAELARQRRNEEAWHTLHGYRTTSGCPCYDESEYACIPKHTGWGYNPNFFVLCCIPFWRESPICHRR